MSTAAPQTLTRPRPSEPLASYADLRSRGRKAFKAALGKELVPVE